MKINKEVFQVLGEQLRPPKPPPEHDRDETWHPDLNPTQKKAFDCNARFLLMWGPKGGAKSFCGGSKLVKHCYENKNALALILVRTQNMAKKGGAWDILTNEVVPHWKNGMGIEFSDIKTDQQHYQYIWVENQFGSWSMIAVMSCPHAHQLRERVRGMTPSMVFVDELTSCPSVEYFRSVAAQVFRRPFVTGPQQYIAACNPEGPSHWVHKEWFENPFDEETGLWDDDFVEMFFPKEENKHRMQEGYFAALKKIYKHDPIESARMEEGQWVDRPAGDALFADIYTPMIHVRPLDDRQQPHPREWLMPDPDHVMIIGLDPGSVYNAFIFQQYLLIDDKMKWLVFDEIVTVRKRISYPDFIPIVMRRIRWWRDLVKSEMKQVWISDASAFNQYRAAQGSFDSMEMEKIYSASRAKYQLEEIKIKSCPAFNGSRVARTRLGQQILGEDSIVVSSRCGAIHRMFLNLAGHKPKDGESIDPEKLLTPIRSDHLHPWDALSYPWLMASLNPTALLPSKGGEQTLIQSAA